MTHHSPDETALRTLLRAQSDAWAAGDGAAFAATFTVDADFVSVIGEFIQGREEIATEMQKGFDGFMKGTRMSEPGTLKIRFPAQGTAIMITQGVRPSHPDHPAGPDEQTLQTRVAIRANGAWLFTSFHNTRVALAPA